MSQANVEIVRRGFAALAEQGVEGVIPFFTEDVVIYSIPEWPDDLSITATTASGGSSGSGRRTSTSSGSNFGTCMTEETGWWASSSSAARQNVPFFR